MPGMALKELLLELLDDVYRATHGGFAHVGQLMCVGGVIEQ